MAIDDPDDETTLEALISQAVDACDTLMQVHDAGAPDVSAEIADFKAKMKDLFNGFSEMLRVGQQGPS